MDFFSVDEKSFVLRVPGFIEAGLKDSLDIK